MGDRYSRQIPKLPQQDVWAPRPPIAVLRTESARKYVSSPLRHECFLATRDAPDKYQANSGRTVTDSDAAEKSGELKAISPYRPERLRPAESAKVRQEGTRATYPPLLRPGYAASSAAIDFSDKCLEFALTLVKWVEKESQSTDAKPQIAAKRMAQAWASGAESLNLGALELCTLPPQIGQLTRLLYIDLSDNKIDILPEELGALHQLKNLTLCQKHPPRMTAAISATLTYV